MLFWKYVIYETKRIANSSHDL
uniref:Uncharacterized protein n=1 Tax=Arundo donax TaxID=35708 RepID=A0A0A9B953_ARUDO